MSIGYDFHKPETLAFSDNEEMMNFIVDNYYEIMKVYRVMKAQYKATRNRKTAAHLALQKMRTMEQEDTLTPAQKGQLEEAKTKMVEEREKNDIHYYRKKELEQNEITLLILRHPVLMGVLEKLDTFGRKHFAGLSKTAFRWFLKPLVMTSEEVAADERNGVLCQVAENMKLVSEAVPGFVEKTVLESMEVNLKAHQPEVKDDGNGNVTYNYSFQL
jgi:hypothetical protein